MKMDVIGQRFGRLVVSHFKGTVGKDRHRAICKCDCGKDKEIFVYSLTTGYTKSCGCLNSEMAAARNTGMKRHQDIAGQRFGRLLVLSRGGIDSARSAKWLCRCDCGVEKEISAASLRKGLTVSCGCFQIEGVRERMTRHGQYQSPTYTVWEGMVSRCENINNKHFRHYGGRGITVCESWRTFEGFLADMGERPAGLTIERDDVNGNYEPGNCRWATMREQSRNRRTNVMHEMNGRRMVLPDWAAEYGLKLETVRGRLQRGWPLERALTKKVP